MRSDLVGAPVVRKSEDKIWVIRAAWTSETNAVWMLIESDTGELQTVQHHMIRMLVPQVMSSYSAVSLIELFPDLLMEFGRREIVAIWTLGLGFDGPLRERIKYGIVAFKEGREGELAAFRAERDAGYPGREPDIVTLRSELKAEIIAELQAAGMLKEEPGVRKQLLSEPGPAVPEPWNPGLPGAHRRSESWTTEPGASSEPSKGWEPERIGSIPDNQPREE